MSLLALAGLAGLMLAGVVADATISMAKADDDTGDDTACEDAGADPQLDASDGASLLDWHEEGVAYSDDLPDPEPVALDLRGDGRDDILTGGGASDIVDGGDGNDLLEGRSGDDAIFGQAGEDHIDGAEGADSLSGGAGNDRLAGGPGNDRMTGGDGNDWLAGQGGHDSLTGGTGDDSLLGGEGDDDLDGGTGDDWLAGGWGDDELSGGAGADTLDGGDGDDRLDGTGDGRSSGQSDYLNGGAGRDVLAGAAGDVMTGGEGSDTFGIDGWHAGAEPARIEDFDGATDQIVVVYDPESHPDPVLSYVTTESGMTVLLDGVAVAELPGLSTLDPNAVRLATEMPLAA